MFYIICLFINLPIEVLGCEPRALHMLGNVSTTELHTTLALILPFILGQSLS